MLMGRTDVPSKPTQYRVFQKELYNGIPDVTGVERWIVCTPLSVNFSVTLATK
jgi:hypothetical protein